ncbi:MAG: universal stress protein [Gemmatimonadota bacterium]
MFDKIVVPVDGSPFGELALPKALGIGCRSGGEVRIVSVVTPLSSTFGSEEDRMLEEERLAMSRVQAQEYMEDLQKRVILSGCDVPISCHVEDGSVVKALDAHVRAAQADLLVMTTHGWGPLRRAWLGSVADGLIRRTPCTILAVRPREGERPSLEKDRFSHILITLDGSRESLDILPDARALAGAFDSRITLFRAIPPHFPLSSPYTSHTTHLFQGLETEKLAARESLEAEARTLRQEGLSVEVATRAGVHPAEGILEYSRSHEVDLIAMATHGRGGVSRLVLGSVADKVLRSGNVPVLLHRSS